MISRTFSSMLAAGAVSLGVACVVLLAGAGSALACVSDTDGDCLHPNYHIQRTDGTLAAWSAPGTGRIVDWLSGNGTPVEVVCETTGPTEAGLPIVVWDQLDDGTYVYGYYLDTPGDGYHPALATCSGSSGGPQPPPGGGPSTPPPPPPPGAGESLPPNKFNAAGAAAWARANVKSSDNPYGYGDDCTDFVSRAMHFGGGMPFIDVSGFVNNKMTITGTPMCWPGSGSAPTPGAPRRISPRSSEAPAGGGRSALRRRPGDLIFVNWGGRPRLADRAE